MNRLPWRMRTMGRLFLLATVPIAISVWTCSRMSGAEGEAPAEFFIEPIKMDPEAKAVLEMTGVRSIAFRYRIPQDHKIVVTFLAENEESKEVLWSFVGQDLSVPMERALPETKRGDGSTSAVRQCHAECGSSMIPRIRMRRTDLRFVMECGRLLSE